MVTIDFYTVEKKENSTYYPDRIADYSLGCTIKEPSSLLSPQIRVNLGITWNPSRLNFAHIEEFHRWYYVNDWTWNNGCWEASLAVDALASWKWEIGQTEFYVLRASNEFSGNVTDNLYPVVSDATQYHTVYNTNPFYSDYSDGCYIIGVVGKTNIGSLGNVTYYAMNKGQFETFNNALWSNIDNWTDIEDVSAELARAIVNPMDYITSCMWFPRFPVLGPQVQTIKFGYWELTGLNAFICLAPPVNETITFDIKPHPQADRGEYLNYAPYTKMWLYFPPFGEIPLNPADYIDIWKIDCNYQLDFITGRANLFIGNVDSGMWHMVSEAQFGVPLELAAYTPNLIGEAVNTGVNALAGFFGLGAEVAQIGSLLEAGAQGSVSKVGTTGSAATYTRRPELYQVCYHIVDEFLEHRGRPLMKRRTPNALGGGFIQVADGDVECHAMPSELGAIKSYLEGGFFYE